MAFFLFDRPEREPSAFVGFAGNVLDRQSETRDDDCVPRALQDPHTRLMLLSGSRLVLRLEGETVAPFFTRQEVEALEQKPADAILLGHDDGGPLLALDTELDPETLPANLKAIDHRSIYSQGLLDSATLGALAQAASLAIWNRTHRFCGRCGHQTESRIGGYKRVCSNCAAEHFPRTDPVAIMLTVRDDRCLLGRSPHFAPGMFSTLAGFIEPGETIENAVRRETLEESGIRIGRVAYHASQPWPFPHSLMIGCFGEALNDDIQPDLTELEDCRWFSRTEVRAMIAGGHPEGLLVPPQGAIASHLIRFWADQD
ncbi:NAD(+) diphosphatase [Tianweitania sp. BSSL-BM11]|uniref:NAD(+) diphosphatase n=1 Tax=Tianweitania aestuarii TaxID=2814886 RepID=A0ABS5RQL4_9HYPH|nr:NAD(+) diphosphatase [Tianweitania aestuarii]MBS9719335.1 NAD(+) diphosphatase [Tianweitania aestuarii]